MSAKDSPKPPAPKGGARKGAGRPPGAAGKRTKLTRAIAEKAIAEGITPLEVMLKTMRKLWDEKKMLEACAIAKECAPYLHPKLCSVSADVNVDVSGLLQLVAASDALRQGLRV